MRWILPLSLLILFEALADIFAKEWSLHGQWWRAIAAIGAYVVANTFWLFALKNGLGLARGGIIFSVACAIMAIGLGLWLYREEASKTQIAGMCMGVISLGLIFWDD
jgi:drug/metabolite transporter (DMT)-like permease